MRSLIIAVAALFLVPTVAQADDDKPRLYLGVGAGTITPTEDNFLSDAGVSLGVSATMKFGLIGIGADFVEGFNGETALGGSTSFRSGSLNAKLMAPTEGVTPYLSAGVGLYRFSAEVLGVNASTDANLQIPVGAGILFELNENIAIGGDFTYHILFNSTFDEDPNRADVDALDLKAMLMFTL